MGQMSRRRRMALVSIRKRINSCLARYKNDEGWVATHQAIDHLFQALPQNQGKNQVIAKLVCIDRIYGGSLYRLGLKSYNRELNKIANAITLHSAVIYNLFARLKSKRKYDPKLRDHCIKMFDSTMEHLYPADRSVLLSKYFHFHAPLFFPVLDRFANANLRRVLDRFHIHKDVSIPKGVSRYSKFYRQIEALYFYLTGDYSFRDLDICLYGDRWFCYEVTAANTAQTADTQMFRTPLQHV